LVVVARLVVILRPVALILRLRTAFGLLCSLVRGWSDGWSWHFHSSVVTAVERNAGLDRLTIPEAFPTGILRAYRHAWKLFHDANPAGSKRVADGTRESPVGCVVGHVRRRLGNTIATALRERLISRGMRLIPLSCGAVSDSTYRLARRPT
jgi:hypothetical protein